MHCLGLIIQKDGDIEEDVTHRFWVEEWYEEIQQEYDLNEKHIES